MAYDEPLSSDEEKKQLEEEEEEDDDVEAGPLVLPPLPEPDRKQQRGEARSGASLVVFLIAVILGLSYAVPLNQRVGHLNRQTRRVYFVLIHLLAFGALVCLERILRGDPGVVRRTEKTCSPMPDVVRDRLREGRSLSDLRNVVDKAGDSYCVRCLVWRPPRAHHCSICQRCVRNFDHHCGVFGRCIAGTATSGNLPFFVAIICIGYLAALLFVVFFIWAVATN